MSNAELDAISADWEMVVGLEVHVQLKTRTKAFCSCSTEFGAPPNRNTCPVCLALPGALPVLNAHAVELATRTSLALNCTVQPVSVFARKNYFYPDLPKGYQISQFDKPLATDGWVEIGARADGSPIRIGVTRVHMEEDAGKSIHDRYPGVSAIDLNRSGTPLVEIVSEPDIRSPEQGRRVPARTEADPRVHGRQRREHGGGQLARRRERQRASSWRDEAWHQGRSKEHELVLRRGTRARGGVHSPGRRVEERRYCASANDAVGREQE
jgi:Glu-tRNA(Gln) amidotransferase subunit E-like FAD-binding protein